MPQQVQSQKLFVYLAGAPKAHTAMGVRCRGRLVRAPAHRSPVPRQLQRLAGVHNLVAIDAQNRNIRIHEVAHIDVATVLAEHHALGQTTYFHLIGASDLFSVDL